MDIAYTAVPSYTMICGTVIAYGDSLRACHAMMCSTGVAYAFTYLPTAPLSDVRAYGAMRGTDSAYGFEPEPTRCADMRGPRRGGEEERVEERGGREGEGEEREGGREAEGGAARGRYCAYLPTRLLCDVRY
eukprot:1602117-Rhodomonas_salina.6